MKKIKKIIVGFWAAMIGFITKSFVYGAVETKYGIFDPSIVEDKYGVYEPTLAEKLSKLGKFSIPVILLIIGLFVIITKKITKKIKSLIILGLIAAGVIGYLVFFR